MNAALLSDPGLHALRVLDETKPYLAGVCQAHEVLHGIGPRDFLHAGPPISVEEVPGPMRGALIAALIFEGEARNPQEAASLIDAGEVAVRPCHEVGAVGAMAGIVTPRMPGVIARTTDRLAFSPLNEGLGGALRYGSFDNRTLERLRWMSSAVVSILDSAIQSLPEMDLCDLIAEGLRRGDECHNRLVATTANLIARFAPAILRTAQDARTGAAVLEFVSSNGHFALPFAIAAAKVIADSARDIPGSPIVTAMAGNGRQFGIRVSGLGERWFLAPSPIGEPKLLDGATMDDVTPTMGDSMIAETVGFGAFALTAAPAIISFLGGSNAQSAGLVTQMRSICIGTSSRFLIPADEFAGTPLGIDVRSVAETGITPVINNGLAHRQPGKGRVGAGITRLPLKPFLDAAAALAARDALQAKASDAGVAP